MSASASSAAPPPPPRPVIIITGANSGVGFGIAQRLLVQLSSATPTDTLPSHPHLTPRHVTPLATPFAAPDGCTLILACRNAIKAHRARAQLVHLLSHLEELPDEAEQPLHVPRSVLDNALEAKINGIIDEDADPALVAQAMEASLRRRRRRNAAISNAAENGTGEDGRSDGTGRSTATSAADRDPTRDPRTGRPYSMLEREMRARGRYRRRFCAGTKIEIQAIDLGSMASALNCAKEVTARHGYVTHVILNAGSSAFTGINWLHAVWMVLTSFHAAVTYPAYKLQRAADVGKDGYGWVWQANVGAHYILARALLPALRATPYSTPSRIIWTGSLEAYEAAYDPSDFQCVDAKKSPTPYESAKYQCELVAHGLEELLNRSRIRTEPGTPLLDDASSASYLETRSQHHQRHGIEPKVFLAHPGVVASSIFAECLNVFLAACMHFAFYLARWTMSKHHNIEGYKGAIAASHVALAPLPRLDPSARYGAQCDWHGREYVFAGQTPSWNAETPTGFGKEAKRTILRRWLQSANREPPAQAGEYVQSLSRDLIIKCEGVAQNVWHQAQEGALLPFADLHQTEEEDGELATSGVAPSSPALLSKASRAAAGLCAQLLPKSQQSTLNGQMSELKKPLTKDASLSSQEDWENVDKSL